MKKKILLILVATIFAIIPQNVDAASTAYYNGGAEETRIIVSDGGCQTNWHGFCPGGTSALKHISIRATIAYIENGEVKDTFGSKCYTDNAKIGNCEVVPEGTFSKNKASGPYQYDSNKIEQFFRGTDNKWTNFKKLFKVVTGQGNVTLLSQISDWTIKTCKEKYGYDDPKNCHNGKPNSNFTKYTGSTKGFRVIIEPLFSGFVEGKLDKIEFMSPRQIAIGYDWTNAQRGLLWSIKLHTTYKDVGIKVPSSEDIINAQTCKNLSACTVLYNSIYDEKFTNLKYGYGFNIIAWPVDGGTIITTDKQKCVYVNIDPNDLNKGKKAACTINGVIVDDINKCTAKTMADCPINRCTYDNTGTPVCEVREKPCSFTNCPTGGNFCLTETTCNDPTRTCDFEPCKPEPSCRCVTATKCSEGCETCDLEPCKNICDYDIETQIPSICEENARSGLVNDDAGWACVFKSQTADDPTVRNHYKENTDNSYCNVFCKETVGFEFPNDQITVYQGRRLEITDDFGGNAPNTLQVIYSGTKTCRVTSNREGKINEEAFRQDIIDANYNIIVAWNDYQNAIALKNAYSNSTAGSWVNDTCAQLSLVPDTSAIAACNSGLQSCSGLISCLSAAISAATCSNNVSLVAGPPCVRYSLKRSWSSSSGSHGTYSQDQDGWTEYEGSTNTNLTRASAQESVVQSKKAIYEATISSRDSLVNKISSCSISKVNIDYDSFNPTVNFSYTEPIYGGEWNLESNLKSDRTTITYHLGGDATGDEGVEVNTPQIRNVQTFDCSDGDYCTLTTKQYSYSTWWEVSRKKEYYYTLPNNVYRYIEKGSGQSVNEKTRVDSQYIDIGYSNLPVHYSTIPGFYDFTLTTTSFGNNNKFNNYIIGDTEFAELNAQTAEVGGYENIDRLDYECEDNEVNYGYLRNIGSLQFNGYDHLADLIYLCKYEVSCNKIIQSSDCNLTSSQCPDSTVYNECTGEGLNLIYRPISLKSKKEAFPGKDGGGRIPGDNWNNDTTIDQHIVNARGKHAYEIYHLDPLYEIDLTPAVIKKVRKYNKEMNKKIVSIYDGSDAYKIGIAGYTSFDNMTCINGKDCKSKLIRGEVAGYEAVKLKGCAISAAGYSKCG